MTRRTPLWFAPIAAILSLSVQEAAPPLVSREEILAELKAAPKANSDREKRMAELFVQAGAARDEVRLQPVARAGNNVMVVKKGELDATIVLGAHLDKVPPGDGVIDDWSGVALVTNAYQVLRKIRTRHTFVFIGFCGEEMGQLGSRHYVASLAEDEVRKCTAMVNLEVLGVGGPFIWTNGSTDRLEEILREVARRENLKIVDHEVNGVTADSIPFERRGIPNITIDGLPTNRFDLIHSPKDTFENVDADVYFETYKLLIPFLRRLDAESPRK